MLDVTTGVETVRRHRHEDASAVTENQLDAVRGFAGEAPQSDDVTLMTLEVPVAILSQGGAGARLPDDQAGGRAHVVEGPGTNR